MEISQAELPISATLAPIVRLPSRTDKATQPHEPLRNDSSRSNTPRLLFVDCSRACRLPRSGAPVATADRSAADDRRS